MFTLTVVRSRGGSDIVHLRVADLENAVGKWSSKSCVDGTMFLPTRKGYNLGDCDLSFRNSALIIFRYFSKQNILAKIPEDCKTAFVLPAFTFLTWVDYTTGPRPRLLLCLCVCVFVCFLCVVFWACFWWWVKRSLSTLFIFCCVCVFMDSFNANITTTPKKVCSCAYMYYDAGEWPYTN